MLIERNEMFASNTTILYLIERNEMFASKKFISKKSGSIERDEMFKTSAISKKSGS